MKMLPGTRSELCPRVEYCGGRKARKEPNQTVPQSRVDSNSPPLKTSSVSNWYLEANAHTWNIGDTGL